jgi:hypothetical protein
LAITNILRQLFIEQILNNWEHVARSLGEADTEELISMSASKVAKTVGRKVLGVRQAGFPTINRSTQSYAKLFRGILNLDPVG